MRAESFREPNGSLRIISGHQDISDLVAAREALAQRRDELEHQVAERTAALMEAEAQFRAVFDSQFQFVAVLGAGRHRAARQPDRAAGRVLRSG